MQQYISKEKIKNGLELAILVVSWHLVGFYIYRSVMYIPIDKTTNNLSLVVLSGVFLVFALIECIVLGRLGIEHTGIFNAIFIMGAIGVYTAIAYKRYINTLVTISLVVFAVLVCCTFIALLIITSGCQCNVLLKNL